MIRVFSQYVSVRGLLLLGLESLLILGSLVLGARLRFWNDQDQFLLYTDSWAFLWQTATVLIVLEICCYYNDLYNLTVPRDRGEQILCLVQALGAGCLLLGALYYIFPGLLVGRGVLFIALVLAGTGISATRSGLDLVWQATQHTKKVLILGDGEIALTTAREFERRSDLNFRVAGFVTGDSAAGSELLGRRVLGRSTDLRAIVHDQSISRIVVALEDSRGALPSRDLVRLKVQGIEVEDAHSALAALTGRVWLRTVRPSWFVFSKGFHRSSAALVMKRIIDLTFGLVGLVAFSPVILLTALAIRLDSKGPIFYRQARVGLGGRAFDLVKFRSMRIDAEAENGAQWARKDDPRITRVGRFIRKYRLDELPQFFNVIRGEMSFVGPRPERPVFVDQLREQIPFYDERHSVRPGVTGWAQVEYGYGASVEDAFRKLEYDLFYLKNLSILFDLAIIVRTVRVVLFGFGV